MADSDLYTVTLRGRRDAGQIGYLSHDDQTFPLDEPVHDVEERVAHFLEAQPDFNVDIEKESKAARKQRISESEEAAADAEKAREAWRAQKRASEAAGGSPGESPGEGLGEGEGFGGEAVTTTQPADESAPGTPETATDEPQGNDDNQEEG